jgi:hypothetical protein
VQDRLGSVPDKLMEAVERAILLTLGMESYTRFVRNDYT